eukprot:858348-Prorocentrum_minimum.AAC.1
MSLKTSAEVLQVGGHGALSVDDGHGGGVICEPEHPPVVRPALLRLLCWIPLHESVVMPMTTSCCACRCVGDIHWDVRVRSVSAQELVVQALLRMPCVDRSRYSRRADRRGICAGRAVEGLAALRGLALRDHHARGVPPIQGGAGAMGRSWVAGAVGFGEQLLSSLHHRSQ